MYTSSKNTNDNNDHDDKINNGKIDDDSNDG